MKITLAEVSDQATHSERTFNKPLVVIGRDPLQCDILFDQTSWPMVSRRHGDFRFSENRWLLTDANSSFGTFVNGERVTSAVEVGAGATVQFGASGPLLLIVEIEGLVSKPNFETQVVANQEAAAHNNVDRQFAPASAQAASLPQTASRRQPTASPKAQSAFLEYVSGMSTKPEPLRLDRAAVMLGRDPASDVPINADAAVVSRRHAEIQQRDDGQYVLLDLGSFNGTLLNNLRIAQPEPLYNDDHIQLGMGGPVFRIVDPAHPRAPKEETEVEQTPSGALAESANFQRTMVVRQSSGQAKREAVATIADTQAHLLFERAFDDAKPFLTVGRASDNDICIDGLQISNHHARFYRSGSSVAVEDAGSTNGVYVNGVRITTARQQVTSEDAVQIGPFGLRSDAARGVAVFDSRSKTRIDATGVTKVVANRCGRGTLKLLDDVSLSIQPNEFVGLLGPSGAGKSTLMDALNGTRPATDGHVLYNDLDLYQHPESLKQAIGYVPQDDIIHRELSVYRTLYYVARLRLSRDVSKQEIDQIIGEVLDVTGLTERRDVLVGQLSGGQRKRVSIAVELITKPSVIFLDEPTSGLDPATEDKIMRLFRQIAESGRTVILTTHAMENVKLFDKIVVLMRGRLVFYGAPQEALAHFGAESFKDLYERLEEPVDAEMRQAGALPADATEEQRRALDAHCEAVTERVADEWRQRFASTDMYRRYVAEPLSGIRRDTGVIQAPPPRHHRSSLTDSARQWVTLVSRYLEVAGCDRLNLFILLAQAPLIALFTYLVVGSKSARDFPYFLLALVAIWFGTSVAAREIVKERAIYGRERMINLGLWPYVASKLVVLLLIVATQCILLFGTLKLLDVAGWMSLPGLWGGLPQLLLMILTGMVGIALGLLVSAMVKTSEMATSIVPLILIPQILFSGLVGVPQNAARIVGAVMPAVWSFDGLKRLSMLDTLQPEGSLETGPNKDLGLYKQIEAANDQSIASARSAVDKYTQGATKQLEDYERAMKGYPAQARTNPNLEAPAIPKLGSPPAVPNAQKVRDDLSNYVDFLHPWGGLKLNPLILFLMFMTLVGATLVVLRLQDAK
ncbi:MAG: FHA domain-containing protein [Pyrinomonadaceae bacterium]